MSRWRAYPPVLSSALIIALLAVMPAYGDLIESGDSVSGAPSIPEPPVVREALGVNQDSAQSNYQTAVEYFRAHDLERARLYAQAGLRQEPDHPMLLSLAGLTELRSGKPDAALIIWSHLERLHPENASVVAGLGAIDFYAGEYGRARARIDRALKIRPGELTALFYQALLTAREHDVPSALRGLNASNLRELSLFARALQDERELILRCLPADRYDAMAAGLLGAKDKNSAAELLSRAVPLLEKAVEFQRSGDLAGLIQQLDAALRAGVGHVLVAYEVGLARYRREPDEDRLRALGAVVDREGGVRFTEAFAELCRRDGYPRIAEELVGGRGAGGR